MNEGEKLSGAARCAILLYALGVERATSILRRIEPQEAARINEAARQLKLVDEKQMRQVLQSFLEMLGKPQLLPGESAEFMRSVLERAGTDVRPLRPAENAGICPEADVDSLIRLLGKEHPQTLAVVLANLDSKRGAKLLEALPLSKRVDVMRRLAQLKQVPARMVQRVEDTLQDQLRQLSASGPKRKVDGVELAANLLKRMNREGSQAVLDEMAKDNAELSTSVRRRMFTFEDLVQMDDRGLRNLMKEIDSQVLAKALKVADEATQQVFFRNMSQRAAAMLQEDIEVLPPMRVAEIEEARSAIVEVATRLINEGKAMIMGAEGE